MINLELSKAEVHELTPLIQIGIDALDDLLDDESNRHEPGKRIAYKNSRIRLQVLAAKLSSQL